MGDALHAAALRLLTARALSENELAQRLQRRGFAADAVALELSRLRQAGLVDDVAVARATCADLLRRGYGRKRLAAALARRGVAAQAAQQALAEVSAEDEREALERALQRLHRRGRHGRTLPPERAKVVRYLLARGFPARLVARVGGSDEKSDDARTVPFDERNSPAVS